MSIQQNAMKKLSLLLSVACMFLLCANTVNAQSVVSVNSNGQIVFNDSLFFPVGPYNLRADSGWTQDLNDCYAAGFNTMFIKNPSSSAILDQANEKGMKVIIESDEVNQSHDFAYCNTYKNHPALIGWIIGDDVQASYANCSVSELQTRHNGVKAVDPNHITMSTGFRATGYGDYSPYIGVCDLNGLYAYPIGNSGNMNQVDMDMSWGRSYSNSNMGIPQMFKWDFSSTIPTAAEYRCMVYQLIINNVNGSLGYVWYDGGSYLPNYTGMYNEVKLVNPELKNAEFITAKMAGTYSRCKTGVSSDASGVKAAKWLYNGITYVVVVNTATSSQSANITLPSGLGTKTSMFSRLPNTLIYSGTALTGTMAGLEVQVIKISSPVTDIRIKNRWEPTNDNEIEVYPNPATSFITVSNVPANTNISAFTMEGNLVSKISVHDNTANFDVKSWNKEMYFLQVQSENSVIVKKVIVE